jgi:uncharacterized protein (DUF983 family)
MYRDDFRRRLTIAMSIVCSVAIYTAVTTTTAIPAWATVPVGLIVGFIVTVTALEMEVRRR